MDYKVKQVKKEDFYEEFNRWSDKHQFPTMHQDLLPEYCFVCYRDSDPIYAIWFWLTNSKMSVITFMMSNKSVSHKKRIGGKKALILGVIQYAKKKKQKMLFCPTSSKDVADVLLDIGFTEGDKNFGQYFYKL